MAGKVNQDTANQVMKDSFGLSADDLGMDRDNAFEGLNFDEKSGESLPDDQIQDDDDNLEADQLPGAHEDDDDEGGRQRQKEPDQKRPDDLRVSHTQRKDELQTTKPKFDRKGNIVAPNGAIIAKAGKEARWYTNLHTARERLTQVQQHAQTQIADRDAKLNKAVEIGIQVANQLQAMRDVGQLHTRAGLDDNDLRKAIEFASAFKKDKLGGLRMILTEAAASGIDLTQLGLQPGGFDPSSLLNMVREEINRVAQPIKQNTDRDSLLQQQQRQKEEAVESARTELNSFLTVNPEAREYLPVITEIYKQPQFANMSLGEVWARIQLNEMRMKEQNPQLRSQNNGQQRLPNGRGQPPNSGGGRQAPDELAPVSDSYEDIVRSVLTAAGQ